LWIKSTLAGPGAVLWPASTRPAFNSAFWGLRRAFRGVFGDVDPKPHGQNHGCLHRPASALARAADACERDPGIAWSCSRAYSGPVPGAQTFHGSPNKRTLALLRDSNLIVSHTRACRSATLRVDLAQPQSVVSKATAFDALSLSSANATESPPSRGGHRRGSASPCSAPRPATARSPSASRRRSR
jgi:hypothetical protein